ncbi:hypothetical protein C8R43DRAFT_978648 [Mycena crocata]|nr:hypothetical protein C8R43DRAFT_978648 [Mycena crocata]
MCAFLATVTCFLFLTSNFSVPALLRSSKHQGPPSAFRPPSLRIYPPLYLVPAAPNTSFPFVEGHPYTRRTESCTRCTEIFPTYYRFLRLP